MTYPTLIHYNSNLRDLRINVTVDAYTKPLELLRPMHKLRFSTPFGRKLWHQVKAVWYSDPSIRTLKSTVRDHVKNILECICKNGYARLTGNDATVRPAIVTAQYYLEKILCELLTKKEISLTCITHTPTRPTPLCTPMASTTFKDDPTREKTVQDRKVSTRELLKNGALHYAVYPSNTTSTPEQLTCYNQTMIEYPGLKDMPIEGNIPPDISGATYIAKYQNEPYFINVRMRQASSRPEETETYTAEIFLGRPTQQIGKRYDELNAFLDTATNYQMPLN